MSSVRCPHKIGALVVCTAMAAAAFGSRHLSAGSSTAPAGRHDFGALAPVFVPNAGNVDRAARFVSVGGGRPVFFTHGDVRLVDVRQQRSLWLAFVDSDALRLDGESPSGGHVTFLHGTQTGNSARQIAYRDVVYRRLWPGIDARITGAAAGLKYSFEIAPHGDARSIHLRYDGADRVAINGRGELTIETGDTTIVDSAPTAYQEIDGRTVAVDVRFVTHDADVSFSVGPYDRERPLVIDPTLVYSTYLGSSGYDAARAIAVDGAGAAYVAGTTRGLDFPATPGSYQPTF